MFWIVIFCFGLTWIYDSEALGNTGYINKFLQPFNENGSDTDTNIENAGNLKKVVATIARNLTMQRLNSQQNINIKNRFVRRQRKKKTFEGFNPTRESQWFNMRLKHGKPVSDMSENVVEFGFEIMEQIALNSNQTLESDNLTQRVRQIMSILNSEGLPAIQENCPWKPVPECDDKVRYRTMDGSCNNLKHPNMGRTSTPYRRLLPPQYKPGSMGLPRVAVDGSRLPNPRVLSNAFATEVMKTASTGKFKVTQLMFSFGQFITHDINNTPMFSGITENKCCVTERREDTDQCDPIEIPVNDTDMKATCMNFPRSRHSPPLSCKMDFRQQMNQQTHWLDMSQVYASTEEDSRDLRAFQQGRMKLDWLPQAPRGFIPHCGEPCNNTDVGCLFEFSLLLGDRRGVLSHPLLSLHTIFLREHNRIANQLFSSNPFATDEVIFQEARRINIGQYQHIVYNEYLPIILAPENNLQHFHLKLKEYGNFSDLYFDSLDARSSNEFAAAAFRFGHSTIPNDMQFTPYKRSSLVSQFFTQGRFYDDVTASQVIQSNLLEEGRKFSSSFADVIRSHLYQTNGTDHNLDLVALNINRGRDHGIRGYIFYHERCKFMIGHKARTFSDLSDVISAENIEKLKKLYRHVDDIDLFVGAMLERKGDDEFLPPTFKCIISENFMKLRLGDRFFYDLNVKETKFSENQLREIRKTSLARIICDNIDIKNTRVQDRVLLMRGQTNYGYACTHTGINLTHFALPFDVNNIKEEKLGQGGMKNITGKQKLPKRKELLVEETCPEGFQRVFNRCFQLLPTKMSFEDGVKACRSMGECVRMYEERDLLIVNRLIKTVKVQSYMFWNGIIDKKKNGRFTHLKDNRPPLLQDKFRNSLRDGYAKQNCMGSKLGDSGTSTWSDEDCNSLQHIICEYPR